MVPNGKEDFEKDLIIDNENPEDDVNMKIEDQQEAVQLEEELKEEKSSKL